MVRRVATRAPVRVAPAQRVDRSHRGQRSRRARDLARRPARRVPSTPRRRHAAALGAGSGQRRIAAAAGHRGCHHALLVAGLARPRVLRRRGLETRVGRGRTGSARDRQRRPLDGYGGTWAADGTIAVSRQAGLFRVPADGGAMTALDETAERGLGALLAEFSAGRPPVPVHREAVDPDRGGQRTRHLPRVAGQPEDRAASARSLERGVRLARLSRLRPRGDARGGAIRPGGGTRHRPADRDRRSGGDRRPVLLRGHFCVSRRDAGGPTAAGGRASPIRTRSMRNCAWSIAAARAAGWPARGSSVHFMALSPIDSRTLAAVDPRPTRRHAGLVADGSLERPHRATDDDARIYREPGLVRRRQATGLRLPASWPDRRRVHQGYRHRGDPAPSSRRPRLASTPSPGPTTVGPCSSSRTTMTRRRICRRGRSRRARSRALSAPGPRKRGVLAPATTTWPSPHRSLVGPRSTSPRFPTIARRGRSRPRVDRC